MARVFFTGANLIDGFNPPQPDATVVIDGDRIAAVGTNGNVPEPAARDSVFDLAGKSLMPGMVMCHFHPTYDNLNTIEDSVLKHPPTYLALVAAKHAELLLRSGFTGAVGAGSMHNVDATLKRAINNGLIQGPRMLACGSDVVATGNLVDALPSWWKMGLGGLAHACDGADEFRKAVREEIKAGNDIIKLYVTGGHGFPPDQMSMTYEELEAAAQTAHERGKKIRGHVVFKKGIMASLRVGMDLIDHADQIDDESIDIMVKQGTFVTPSLYFTFEEIKLMRRMGRPAAEISRHEQWLEQTCQAMPNAHKAGVKLVVGDDFGTSWMPHGRYADELEFYVKHGVASPLEVIGWATRNGADLMGMKDQLGTIEAGKLADLLVVNGDPIRDISLLTDRGNLDVVMKGGAFVECRLTPSAAAAKAA